MFFERVAVFLSPNKIKNQTKFRIFAQHKNNNIQQQQYANNKKPAHNCRRKRNLKRN